MKKTSVLLLLITLSGISFAQKPSKEQIEKDKKAYAESQKKLNEQLANMDPKAKQSFDSLMNAMGMGNKIQETNQKIDYNAKSAKTGSGSVGLIPEKNSKAIASIRATPSSASLGSFIGTGNNKVFSTVLPAAKNKASEIYKALKDKGADADEIGNAATALWMMGKTQIALCLMSQVCSSDASNIDNLNNYASMLTMLGAPEMAIPILNNLNARFKKNTTILNNIGQAWFALGDIDKANKYLDSTLLLNAGHAQANETKCLIAESKGNKTAAIAHAKAAFKSGATQQRRDKLKQLGYTPSISDYGNFPPLNKSDDLLQLGGFEMPPLPKSVAEWKILKPIWKQFRTDIDKQIKPLEKLSQESTKAMEKETENMMKQGMQYNNAVINNPGSVSRADFQAIAKKPLFAEEMNMKQNIVLQNLTNKKMAIMQRLKDFVNGDGALIKKKYQDAMKKINDEWKKVGEGSSVNDKKLCRDAVKAADEFLLAYNSKVEELYKEFLVPAKQYLNEFSYTALYTQYKEMMPGVNAGLKINWLRALSNPQNGFDFESFVNTNYECTDKTDAKGGKLTAFKDPNCNINSEFNVGLSSFGGSIKMDCNGMTTTFNAGILGVTLNQNLDQAGFGDSFENCTVSIGPKVSAGGKVGPLEANVSAGAGVDIEIDRTGISDVVLTGGVEAGAGMGPAGASAGVEGRMSLNTGAGSIQGTGIFK